MSIKYRLFFALLGATGVAVLCMFLLLQWSVDRGFLQYVNTIERQRLQTLASALEQAYEDSGSWDFMREEPLRRLRQLSAGEPETIDSADTMRSRSGTERSRADTPRSGRWFDRRVVLLAADRQPVFGSPEEAKGRVEFLPLSSQGEVVGYLGLQPRQKLADIHQLRFVKEQKLIMAAVAGIVLLLSAGLSLPLANRLLRPIRALASGTHRLAAGEYAARVTVDSADELGRLAANFNTLAVTLEQNEQARRRWVADISHELRTPLTVLRGEIEALQDGIRQPNAEAVASLHAEVLQLGRLVDDLYQLSMSDVGALTYRKEHLDLREVVGAALAGIRQDFQREKIDVSCKLPNAAVPVFADRDRLRQLFGNLLDNSLNYTDSGGRLEIRLERQGEEAMMHLLDSSPGVPEPEIPRLFDRLYRVEGSRSRATGGAGLGLAICANIAEAHGGSIAARPSPLGGVWMEVRLPCQEEKG